LTSRTPELEAPDLKLAWFGHALGTRGDGLTTYSADVVGGLLGRGAEVWFHHASRDGTVTPVDASHTVSWPTWRFKTVTVAQPGFRRSLAGWLREVQPQVVHASLSFTLQDGWLGRQARASGAATVATFHLPFGRPGSGRGLVMRELHRFWAPRLRAYQRVIVFSEDHRQRLSSVGVDRARIEVLANAVDVERFQPGISTLRESRLPGASLVVGYAGRLDPEKGVRELLQGFRAANLGPEARLIVAGQGALLAEVLAAEEDPRVVYLGQLLTLQQRVDFWRAVDVFCLPSSAEGLSIALLEAMASGCAVAATPAGGASALGNSVHPLEPERLSQSIAEWLAKLDQDRHERDRFGRSARDQAVRHYGMAAMLDRLLEIYGDCQADLE
jgi:glycosyltransferase involved in cell wall biosynthesis